MILITSSGPVGVKYMVDGLGALPKYDSVVFKDLGIASAYCFPMSVRNEQNSFAIFTFSVHFSPLTINVSESDVIQNFPGFTYVILIFSQQITVIGISGTSCYCVKEISVSNIFNIIGTVPGFTYSLPI